MKVQMGLKSLSIIAFVLISAATIHWSDVEARQAVRSGSSYRLSELKSSGIHSKNYGTQLGQRSTTNGTQLGQQRAANGTQLGQQRAANGTQLGQQRATNGAQLCRTTTPSLITMAI